MGDQMDAFNKARGQTSAFLIYDGTDEVRIPPAMGEPRADQMQGTVRERLCELAARCCYDSLGKGRSSVNYWKHILEVRHLSVLEHAAVTVELTLVPCMTQAAILVSLLNRPSLWTQCTMNRIRVTLNPRHILEWGRSEAIGYLLNHVTYGLFPKLFPVISWSSFDPDRLGIDTIHIDKPETDEEKWITLFLVMSRGASHEIVRHGDWTAISMRSTRYVDESESAWIDHPLWAQYHSEHSSLSNRECSAVELRMAACKLYDMTVQELQAWLVFRGVDKVAARKQARGAARGFLGNALQTEVVFSASVAQWRHILEMRLSDAADAEIREVMCKALACLKGSRYGDRFSDFKLCAAADGIGQVLSST